MNKQELREELISLLGNIRSELPEAEMVTILQGIIRKVSSVRYRLRDMPLITGALNLLISSVVLDHEEREAGNYEGSVELKTIVDLAME